VETFAQLKNRHKGSDFFFIIGIDAFLDLPKWKHPVRLMELTNFVIISRPGFCFEFLHASPYLLNAGKRALREFEKGSRTRMTLKLVTGRRAFLLKTTGFDISASRIRSLIRKGKNIKYLLPESVESYIISHKLYR
jgi:nicotinate-nucleotide adenylyltransferase